MSMIWYTIPRLATEYRSERLGPDPILGGSVVGKIIVQNAAKSVAERIAASVAKNVSTRLGARLATRTAKKAISKSVTQATIAQGKSKSVAQAAGKQASKSIGKQESKEIGQFFLKDLEEQGIIQAGKRTVASRLGRGVIKTAALGGLLYAGSLAANKLFGGSGEEEETAEEAALADTGIPSDTGTYPSDTSPGTGETAPGLPAYPGLPGYPESPYQQNPMSTPVQGSPISQSGYNPWYLLGFSDGIVGYI